VWRWSEHSPEVDNADQDQYPWPQECHAIRNHAAYSHREHGHDNTMAQGEEKPICGARSDTRKSVNGGEMIGIRTVTHPEGKSNYYC
jgi:hypothetical protein